MRYFFPKDSLEMLNRYISARCHSDASGKYIEWLVQEARVYGYPLKGSWFDIGRYESLKSAEEEFKKIKNKNSNFKFSMRQSSFLK